MHVYSPPPWHVNTRVDRLGDLKIMKKPIKSLSVHAADRNVGYWRTYTRRKISNLSA